MKCRAFRPAFLATIPVLLGYLSIGIAFGLMLQAIGYNWIWAAFMSITIYAGSMQYMAVDLLARGASLPEVLLMTLVVNARHLVYGFSMFQKFSDMGWRKPYMIAALTDETYALLSSAEPPEEIRGRDFYFWIALLDHSYWVLGSVIGAVAGSLITFNTQGIDFAMTALFVVICTEQWISYPSRIPALIGAGCTLLSLWIFGPSNLLLPALCVMVALLYLIRPRLEPAIDRKQTGKGDA